MIKEAELDALLEHWEESVERGEPLSVEELCANQPSLVDALRERIDALKTMNRLLDLSEEKTEPVKHRPPVSEQTEFLSEDTLAAEIGLLRPQFYAKGGLGTVFKADDAQLHREVAVKFLHPEYAHEQDSRNRFCQEAEITSRLDHPGIVPVHGIGETQDGRPFYVMRLVRGETLETAIKHYHSQAPNWNDHKRNLEFRALLTRFVSVCNTIAYAHNRGIIHRDIKPENILLGRYGETLVVDWGLAMPVKRDDRARESGERTLLLQTPNSNDQRSEDPGAGTPVYMSPEQAGGSAIITTASDVYSLGAVLYKILTGHGPVDGRQLGLAEIRNHIREGRFPRPREMVKTVPRSLEAVCLKAMSLEPRDRYPSALLLAEEVERYLGDERVQAYRESPLETPFRWFRQHRRMAQVTLVSIFLLLAVLVGSSSWLARLANKTAAANEELLQSAAKLTALTVAMEINDRWRILEMESSDSELIHMMAQASDTPEQTDWEGLLHWLGRAERVHRITAHAESWFLCDATGRQVARIPETKSIGENFAHRDYFHGNGLDLPPGQRGDPFHIDGVHLSTPYQSSNDGDMKVAFTIPIWSHRLGLPGRRFLGVLGMSIKLGHFEILQQNLGPDQVAVLADLNTDELSGDLQSGLILHHPMLSDELHDAIKNGELAMPRLQPELVERLRQFRYARLREHRASSANTNNNAHGFLLDHYTDPIEALRGAPPGHWLAAVEPVFVEGRSPEAQDTGWVVIVEKRIY